MTSATPIIENKSISESIIKEEKQNIINRPQFQTQATLADLHSLIKIALFLTKTKVHVPLNTQNDH